MRRMELKYGTNPHQGRASAVPIRPDAPPLEVLSGKPSFINFLDALNAWQLVREARAALGVVAAASFKHVSPAGAAVAVDLPEDLARAYEVHGTSLTPAATAYVRARGADPKSSFGDFVALSDVVDEATALFLKGVVSDGIVAPGYEPAARTILEGKKGGSFIVMRADPDFVPPETEAREVYGMRLTQERNAQAVSDRHLADVVVGSLPPEARRDLLLGLVAIKYTQSNSVGYALDGQMIGIGAGQQSRVDCTKLAGQKADVWHLGRHPKVLGLSFRPEVKRQERINWRIRFIEGDLTPEEEARFRAATDGDVSMWEDGEREAWVRALKGVSLVSDGFIPFRDNIDHAARHGVRYVAQPGGSTRDDDVARACEEHGIAMAHTHLRLFHH